MPDTNFESGEMKTYRVIKSFHLGEIKTNLSAGDTLEYDGMDLVYRSKTYSSETLRLAIKAGHVVEDDGTVEYKKREEVAAKKPPVVVQDHDDLVVARVQRPDELKKYENQWTRKPTEVVAKTTHETAPNIVTVEEQRVVGSATRRKSSAPQAAMVSEAEADSVRSGQRSDARVVNAGKRTRDRVQEMLAAEGVDVNATNETPVMAGDDGKVVGKIMNAEERKAKLLESDRELRKAMSESSEMTPEERAAFERDLEIAKAKRSGKVPPKAAGPRVKAASTAPKEEAPKPAPKETVEVKSEPEVTTGTDAEPTYPKGFPANDHWRRRLVWCQKNKKNEDALKAVYALSTVPFQKRLAREFPDVSFS